METKIFRPKYLNLADLIECDNPKDSKGIKLILNLNRWHDIQTSFSESFDEGGLISNIPIISGKNVEIEILYDGKIRPIDAESCYSDDDCISYPCENPIFNSELLKVVAQNHYHFKTKYPTKNFRFPSLSQSVVLTPEREDIENRRKEVNPGLIKELIHGDDLKRTLFNLYQFVESYIDGNKRKDGQDFNFSEIYDEFVATKRISGDCKSISTFTAGLINSLGLRSRCLETVIYFEKTVESLKRKKEVNHGGHQYAEVYIPVNESGVWVPVDPATDCLFKFPKWEQLYTFNNVRLPKFDDLNKKAQIRINYV